MYGFAIVTVSLRQRLGSRGQILDGTDIIAFLVIGETEKITGLGFVRRFGDICKKLDCRVCLPSLK
jgi:hypothetical protein